MKFSTGLAAGLFASLLLTACVGSDSDPCSWDEVCPADYRCHEPTHSCELPAAIVVCDGLTDGEGCTYPGAPSESYCLLGVCEPPACGDGIRQTGEGCDDGAENSDSVPDACRTDCTSGRCGDGVVDAGEGCDDGAENSDSVPDACRTDCTSSRCGDGVVDTGEICDDGNATDGDGCEADCLFRSPTTLASGQTNPYAIAVDSTHVYWVNRYNNGEVMKVPLAGGTAIAFASGQTNPYAIAVDSTHVYWVNWTGNNVMKVIKQ